MEINSFDSNSVSYSQFSAQESVEVEAQKWVQVRLRQFLRTFNKVGQEDLMTGYRDQLSMNYNQGKYAIEVDYQDLLLFDKTIAERLRKEPERVLKKFEVAAKECQARNMITDEDAPPKVHDIQVQIVNFARKAQSLRDLGAEHVSKLVQVPGIVISAGKVQARALRMRIQCSKCKREMWVQNGSGFGSVPMPRVCPTSEAGGEGNNCGLDPFIMIPDKCVYIDTQRLKLQEKPEDVPTGEMPRHMSLSLDREYVDKVKPGSRVNMIGIYSIYTAKPKGNKRGQQTAATIRHSYLKVVGVEMLNATEAKGSFEPEEEEELRKLSQAPNAYENIYKSIAPNIFGHDDIKKAIACLMFGGSRKFLAGGMRLRGDINVLLLGDPSVAKSQFLKYVHQVAPIGVYTSGKGSSAAGLTASVIKDPGSGEFHLEGGAMVLADGGVVCIDEFDKMREDDRIAIHEAMEQQTISIAKAGITTILNSRCSVLAAANPIFGRYDDMRTVAENIDFQSTILSRFDLIFIIRDNKDVDNDMRLAKHIMDFHINVNSSRSNEDCPITADTMSKYVAFARKSCKPRLTPEAAEALKNHYVQFRQTAKRREETTGQQSAIPITVRQLEAIIRISESLAKMRFSENATVDDVKEAVRLFRFATMRAVQQGHLLGEGGLGGNNDFITLVQKAEDGFREKTAVGSQCSVAQITRHLKERGHDEHAVLQGLHFMFLRGEIEYFSGRRMLRRRK